MKKIAMIALLAISCTAPQSIMDNASDENPIPRDGTTVQIEIDTVKLDTVVPDSIGTVVVLEDEVIVEPAVELILDEVVIDSGIDIVMDEVIVTGA